MTRKHYIILAASFRDALKGATDERREGILAAIGFVCIGLARDNPRFNAERFVAACLPDDRSA